MEEIHRKREKMVEAARITGFTSEETVSCSQELDELLNEYHRTANNSYDFLREEKIVYRHLTMIITRPELSAVY
nr:aspartyl-phosphate phosphatase Spo0E family protein [Mesobacillus harenae]